MACVYRILNKVNGKFYIGSTKGELRRRKSAHLAKLRHNKHYNSYLQNAWNKYGEENFEFIEIETIIFEKTSTIKESYLKLRERELHFIVNLNPHYNINRITADGSLGRVLSEEQKDHLRKKLKGRKRTSEEIENIRRGKLGVKQSQEHRDAMIKAKLNKPIRSSRPVLVFNLNNELLFEYAFQGQAAKELGINKTSISNNINGRRRIAGKYIFKFKE